MENKVLRIGIIGVGRISGVHIKGILDAKDGEIVAICDVDEEKIEKFSDRFDEQFGENAEISPKSIVDVKKFELVTPDVQIKVNPERTDLVSTQVIDGVRYIMIKANTGVEVNGINIDIK